MFDEEATLSFSSGIASAEPSIIDTPLSVAADGNPAAHDKTASPIRDELMTDSVSSRGPASLLASTLQKQEDDHAIQSGVQSC